MIFKVIPDAHALLVKDGVYRQAPLFVLDNDVYAKYGAGFIRLHHNHVTSISSVRWRKIFGLGDLLFYDNLGRMTYVS